RFICALQPAMSDDRNILHYELLLRLNHLGTIIDANYFMPVILHFKWMDKIDKYVISHLIACGQEVPIAVNLSLSFIQQNANLKWLKEQLRDFKQNKSAPICFEISNNSIIQDTDSCIELSNMLQAFGYNIGVDHFMVSSHNLSYLQTIKPKYIKIDAQYLISLLKGSSEELPNRSLITLTELLNIMIIAIGVDSKELLDELKTLHINYFQGNYIAKSKLHQVT
ncbi:MAG: EAL domain-containing protein, partial [Campylobacterota bacterium]|nr:EAL domain-containing protein [Campylobacterota bacterium]